MFGNYPRNQSNFRSSFLLLDFLLQLFQLACWCIKHPFHGFAGLGAVSLLPSYHWISEIIIFTLGSFVYEHLIENMLIPLIGRNWGKTGAVLSWRLYAVLHFTMGVFLGLLLCFAIDVWLKQAEGGFRQHPLLIIVMIFYFLAICIVREAFDSNLVITYILSGLSGGITALFALKRRFNHLNIQ